jgi:anti-repressor protein
MKDLIPITESTINGQRIMCVDARNLHRGLEVQTAFKDWIVRRITDYEFKENVDYWVSLNSELNPLGGRPAKEYTLTINMGKELCMVERTPIGHKVRQYFLECERSYLQAHQPLSDEELMSRAYVLATNTLKALEAERARQTKLIEYYANENKLNAPKVKFYDAVTESEGDIELGDLSAFINQAGYRTGRNRLMEELRELGFLVKQPGIRWNMPTQKAVEMGVLVESEKLVYDRHGRPVMDGDKHRTVQYSAVTPRGQQYFIDFFIRKMQKTLPPHKLWGGPIH